MIKSKKGFTLIELIVVLAILAIIMAIAVPTAFGSIESARESADRGSIDGFNSAIRMRSSFALAETSNTAVDKTIGKAFTDSGISKTTAAQSTALYVKWNAPTSSACGFFEVVADPAKGTKLTKGTSLHDQLITLAGGKDTAIIA